MFLDLMWPIARKALQKALQKVKMKEHSTKVQDSKSSVSKDFMSESKVSLQGAPKSELYLLVLALQDPDYYRRIQQSMVIDRLNHTGIAQMFYLLDKFDKQSDGLKYFQTWVERLLAHVKEPKLLQKDNYPSLKHLSSKKIEIFIQDCVNKVRKRAEAFCSSELLL